MDESRPLLISNIISGIAGAGWLLLVYLTPPPPPTISLLRPEEAAAVEVEFEDERPKPPPPKEDPVPPNATPEEKKAIRAKKEEKAMADAFGGASPGLVGDVTNALRGVEVSKGGGGAGGAGTGGGKAVIAYGSGGAGARTPGRGVDASVAAAGDAIGRVNAAGSVSRVTIAVAAPTVVRSSSGGGSGRDMTRLGAFVRARQAQLQYCYTDVGLAANPALAGSISVTVTLEQAGTVSDVKVASRSWSGAGVAEAEGCILTRVRGWSFPSSSKPGAEGYSFSFIFNK